MSVEKTFVSIVPNVPELPRTVSAPGRLELVSLLQADFTSGASHPSMASNGEDLQQLQDRRWGAATETERVAIRSGTEQDGCWERAAVAEPHESMREEEEAEEEAQEEAREGAKGDGDEDDDREDGRRAQRRRRRKRRRDRREGENVARAGTSKEEEVRCDVKPGCRVGDEGRGSEQLPHSSARTRAEGSTATLHSRGQSIGPREQGEGKRRGEQDELLEEGQEGELQEERGTGPEARLEQEQRMLEGLRAPDSEAHEEVCDDDASESSRAPEGGPAAGSRLAMLYYILANYE